jgi:DNA-binding protein HU-beta
VNKNDLAQELATRLDVSRSRAATIVDEVFGPEGVICQALLKEDKVQISGFGQFEVRHRAARTGRNPRTGESIELAASRAPAFKAGKALKDQLNAG